MEQTRQFTKLPMIAKEFILEFQNDNDKTKLFDNIKKNIETQKTVKSKHTRQSTFRGILKKWFDFKVKDLKPIDFTKDEKQQYYDSNQKSFDLQCENIIDLELFEKLLLSKV